MGLHGLWISKTKKLLSNHPSNMGFGVANAVDIEGRQFVTIIFPPRTGNASMANLPADHNAMVQGV